MPSLETGLALSLFPGLMKIPSGPRPPLVTLLASGDPGCGPSGEMETRAERFPGGITGGGGAGEGAAESATIVALSIPLAAISGAERFETVRDAAERGADIGVTGSAGFAGVRSDAAMFKGPGCLAAIGTTGIESLEAARCEAALGFISDSSTFGRGGSNRAS